MTSDGALVESENANRLYWRKIPWNCRSQFTSIPDFDIMLGRVTHCDSVEKMLAKLKATRGSRSD